MRRLKYDIAYGKILKLEYTIMYNVMLIPAPFITACVSGLWFVRAWSYFTVCIFCKIWPAKFCIMMFYLANHWTYSWLKLSQHMFNCRPAYILCNIPYIFTTKYGEDEVMEAMHCWPHFNFSQKGMLTTFPQCNFSLEFLKITCQNHRLSVSGNS